MPPTPVRHALADPTNGTPAASADERARPRLRYVDSIRIKTRTKASTVAVTCLGTLRIDGGDAPVLMAGLANGRLMILQSSGDPSAQTKRDGSHG